VGYIGSLMKQAVITNNGTGMFGKANRPSTPIQGVINNSYANTAAEERGQVYEVFGNHQMKKQTQKLSHGNTRAQQMAAEFNRKQLEHALRAEKIFKMKRFDKVQARTNAWARKTGMVTDRAPEKQEEKPEVAK